MSLWNFLTATHIINFIPFWCSERGGVGLSFSRWRGAPPPGVLSVKLRKERRFPSSYDGDPMTCLWGPQEIPFPCMALWDSSCSCCQVKSMYGAVRNLGFISSAEMDLAVPLQFPQGVYLFLRGTWNLPLKKVVSGPSVSLIGIGY